MKSMKISSTGQGQNLIYLPKELNQEFPKGSTVVMSYNKETKEIILKKSEALI